MQDLLALKKALEKPGIGKKRYEIAEQFKSKRHHVPLSWIRKWLDTDWHTAGCNYLWLAAMNACINRPNTPIYLIYRGLCKPDPYTFNAAIEACRGRKIPPKILLSWWYDSGNIVLQLAAITACIGNPNVSEEIIERARVHKDIRIRKMAEQIAS